MPIYDPYARPGPVRYTSSPPTRKKKRKGERSRKQLTKPSRSGKRLRSFRLYALRLDDGCYYVGLTAYRDVTRRFAQHLIGKGGARWTALHRPIEIIEVREVGMIGERTAWELEERMTVEYISRYGVHLVRGGSMCRVDDNHHLTSYNTYMRAASKAKAAKPHRGVPSSDPLNFDLAWLLRESRTNL